MPDDTPNLHVWLNAPRDSRLTISLTGTTTSALVTGDGIIRSDNSPPRPFVDGEVQPGPLTFQLVGKDSCTAVLIVKFASDASADVAAFVEAPNGTRHPVDYEHTFVRGEGSVETVVFIVVTV